MCDTKVAPHPISGSHDEAPDTVAVSRRRMQHMQSMKSLFVDSKQFLSSGLVNVNSDKSSPLSHGGVDTTCRSDWLWIVRIRFSWIFRVPIRLDSVAPGHSLH